MADIAEQILLNKGVKPTANRLLILRALIDKESPLSLSELENELSSMDKSSIFRTLNLFVEHHITHQIDDGVIKYEVCHGVKECTISDMHTHFHCNICHRTYCLHDSQVPIVPLPEGFEIESVNYMIKGICPNCKRKEFHN